MSAVVSEDIEYKYTIQYIITYSRILEIPEYCNNKLLVNFVHSVLCQFKSRAKI